jgi:hypothetical protein
MHNFVYEKKKDCFKVESINKNKIELLNIKKNITFDPTTVFKFGTFTYLDSYNNRWNFKRTSVEGFNSTVSIGIYKSENPNLFDRSELYNIAIHYIASELSLFDNFKHIVLPVMFFDIESTKLKELNEPLRNMIGSDNKLFYVMITEHYFKMVDLKSHIKLQLSELEWKIIIFQVLIALVKLNIKFNGFKHNNLNLKAIKLYYKEKSENKNIYKIHDVTFAIPEIGIELKLTDFDFSNANNYIINKDSNLSYTEKEPVEINPFFDVYFFFNELNKYSDMMPKKIKDFVSYILTNSLTDLDNMSNKNPTNLLKKNPFFEEFIVNTPLHTILPKHQTRSKRIYNIIDQEMSLTDAASIEPRFLAKKVSPLYNNSMIAGSRYIESSEAKSVSEHSAGSEQKKTKKHIESSKKKEIKKRESSSSSSSSQKSNSSSSSSSQKHRHKHRHSRSRRGGQSEAMYKMPSHISQGLSRLPDGEIPEHLKDNLFNYMAPPMPMGGMPMGGMPMGGMPMGGMGGMPMGGMPMGGMGGMPMGGMGGMPMGGMNGMPMGGVNRMGGGKQEFNNELNVPLVGGSKEKSLQTYKLKKDDFFF